MLLAGCARRERMLESQKLGEHSPERVRRRRVVIES
jgi:hypothetical protein